MNQIKQSNELIELCYFDDRTHLEKDTKNDWRQYLTFRDQYSSENIRIYRDQLEFLRSDPHAANQTTYTPTNGSNMHSIDTK